MPLTKSVKFKLGDLLLVNLGYLREMEVQEVSQSARALKLDETWYEVDKIAGEIKGKLGTVIYKKGLLGVKRIVLRT